LKISEKPLTEDQELTISVIVCAYTQDRWNDLATVIEALQNQTIVPQEIIVVIDHNQDLLQRVQDEFPDVVAVANKNKQGLSGGRNTGVAIATGDVIAFLDDDAIVPLRWIEGLQATYSSEDIAGVGGPVEPLWQEGRPRWFPEEFDWIVGCTFLGMPETISPVQRIIGCNMSFRRQAFEVAGDFIYGLGRIGKVPLAGEETEFCIRLRNYWPDAILVYNPDLSVQHRVPTSRANWRYFRARSYAEGISKAVISNLVGSGEGLHSERTYVFRTLPMGVLRAISDVFTQGNVVGLSRAFVIVAGLSITGWAYLVSKVRRVSISSDHKSFVASSQGMV